MTYLIIWHSRSTGRWTRIDARETGSLAVVFQHFQDAEDLNFYYGWERYRVTVVTLWD